MTDDKRIEIAIIVAVFSFVILLFKNVILKKQSRAEVFAKKAEKTGCVTTAKAVSKKVRMGNGDISSPMNTYTKYIVKYAYNVDGEEYIKKMVYKKTWTASLDYPSEITVYYDKNNPQKSYSHFDVNSSAAYKKSIGCTSTIFLPIVVMIVVFSLLKFIP